MFKIDCLVSAENHLGEGPIWDDQLQALFWVDGTGNRVGNPAIWKMDYASGKIDNWYLDKDIGAMAIRKNGQAVLALSDGFYFFNFDDGSLDLIEKVDSDNTRIRLNDGKTDRRGRFIAGGMDDKEELDICSLWQLDSDLTVKRLEENIICCNGPCWSPDDSVFYCADTFKDTFSAYSYDIETGLISSKREFASSKNEQGLYDGATVDSEGCLWTAMVIGGDLIRYNPDGSIDRKIGMPVKNITSLCFGGPNLDEIFVTSMARVVHPATHDHFAADAHPQFSAGSLYRISGLGIKGIPEPRFAG